MGSAGNPAVIAGANGYCPGLPSISLKSSYRGKNKTAVICEDEVELRKRQPMGIAGVVVITGASSGIGRCAAALFARQGWRVGLIARGEVGLQAASGDVERQGAVAATARADVVDLDALEEAATHIERALGPIDVWVNCAGNGTYGRFLDTPAAEFQRVTDVTYQGTVNGTRVALRRMLPRDSGRIVNVCSAVAFRGMPLLSSYSGAKHAVRARVDRPRARCA
jgi:short-subunit dehydrogenase